MRTGWWIPLCLITQFPPSLFTHRARRFSVFSIFCSICHFLIHSDMKNYYLLEADQAQTAGTRDKTKGCKHNSLKRKATTLLVIADHQGTQMPLMPITPAGWGSTRSERPSELHLGIKHTMATCLLGARSGFSPWSRPDVGLALSSPNTSEGFLYTLGNPAHACWPHHLDLA